MLLWSWEIKSICVIFNWNINVFIVAFYVINLFSCTTNHLTHCGLVISYHKTLSSLVQAMALCLFSPRHYWNLCWLLINWTLKKKLQANFIILKQEPHSENNSCKILAISTRGQWVKVTQHYRYLWIYWVHSLHQYNGPHLPRYSFISPSSSLSPAMFTRTLTITMAIVRRFLYK